MHATTTIVQAAHHTSTHYMQNESLPNAISLPNGQHHAPPPLHQQTAPQPPAQSSRSQTQIPVVHETISVVGVPSVSIKNNRLCVGDAQTSMCFTRLKSGIVSYASS